MASVSDVAATAAAVALLPIDVGTNGALAAVLAGSDEGATPAPDVEEGSFGPTALAEDGYGEGGSDPLAGVVGGVHDAIAGAVQAGRDPLAESAAASSAFDWAALGLEDVAGVTSSARPVTGSSAVRVQGQAGPVVSHVRVPPSLADLIRIGRTRLEVGVLATGDDPELTARALIAEAEGGGIAEAEGDWAVVAPTPKPSVPIVEQLGVQLSGGTVTVTIRDIERSSWRTQRADVELLVKGLDTAAAEVGVARGLVQVRLLEPTLRRRLFGLSTLAGAVAAQAQGRPNGTLPGDMSVEEALILLTAAGIAPDKIVPFIRSDARVAMAALRQIQSTIAGVVTSLSRVDGADLTLSRLDRARITAVLHASQPSSQGPAPAISADEAVPLIVLYGMLGASGRDSSPLSGNLARALDVFVARHARVPYTAIARIVTEQLVQLAVDLRAVPPGARRREESASVSLPDPLRVDAGAAAQGDTQGGSDGQAGTGASPE